MRYSLLPRLAFAVVAFALPVGAQTLQRLAPRDRDSAVIQVFADGNVKNALANPGAATSASGSLGLRYAGPTFVASGTINVGGTKDTLTQGFGTSLLAPATGSALSAGVLEIRRRHIWGLETTSTYDATGSVRKTSDDQIARASCDDPTLRWSERDIRCNFGLRLYFTGASALWATQIDTVPPAAGSTTATPTTKIRSAVNVPAVGAGLGGSYTFFTGQSNKNEAAMVLDFGVAWRGVRGDLISTSRAALRESLSGTKTTDFFGAEIGLGMQFNQLSANMTYYRMSGSMDGFSRGQLVAGVSIQTNLNEIPLTPKTTTPQ